MLSYRLYFLGPEGHIVRAVEFECASDEDALNAVEQHADGRSMELWQQARKVRAFSTQKTAGHVG
jgi:hypothetical protein